MEESSTVTDDLMDRVDRLGHEAHKVDPRAWPHLLAYAPPSPDLLRALRNLVDSCSATSHFGTKFGTKIPRAEIYLEALSVLERFENRASMARVPAEEAATATTDDPWDSWIPA